VFLANVDDVLTHVRQVLVVVVWVDSDYSAIGDSGSVVLVMTESIRRNEVLMYCFSTLSFRNPVVDVERRFVFDCGARHSVIRSTDSAGRRPHCSAVYDR